VCTGLAKITGDGELQWKQPAWSVRISSWDGRHFSSLVCPSLRGIARETAGTNRKRKPIQTDRTPDRIGIRQGQAKDKAKEAKDRLLTDDFQWVKVAPRERIRMKPSDAMVDIRYALRGFCRSPIFALVAVLSLALGIGANIATFNLVNTILLRTLPVYQPDRLVIFALSAPDRFFGSQIPLKLFQQLRDKNTVLDGFAGAGNPPMTLSGVGIAERVNGQIVSGNYFETLGVNAIIGRVLTANDDHIPDAGPVCVIGYGFWMRRFGGDRNVIGRTIAINGHPLTVLGVTPKEFTGLSPDLPVDVTVPLMMASIFKPYRVWLQPFGRLKPGVSTAQAQASLDFLYHELQPQLSSAGSLAKVKVLLEPGSRGLSSLRSQYGRPLLMLMMVAGLLLLIACANVTNLLMARAASRVRQTAVRLVLGASHVRLIRQLLAESMLLSIGGAMLGVAVAYWVDHALVALAAQEIRGSALILSVNPAVNPDWRVLLFTLFVTLLIGLLSGIVPAIKSTRVDTRPASGLVLKGDADMRAPRTFSFSSVLVVGQIALALVVLIGAGLLVRSLHNLKSVDPGFVPDRIVVLTVQPTVNGYSQAASHNFVDGLMERARNLPGVIAASPAFVSPLSGVSGATTIDVPGYVPRSEQLWSIPDPDYPWMIPVNWVGPDYFKTLGARLLAGREFNNQDGLAKKVAIVNEKTAAHFWPHENPIGKHTIMGGREGEDCEIVGVVKDLTSDSLRKAAPATVYMPFRQHEISLVTLHVRVAGKTTPVISALVSIIHELDPNLAAFNVTTLHAQLDRTIASDRLLATLTALFGLLALVIAAVGLYGVVAFVVGARTREIGIRMALGAGRARLLGQVMGESGILTAIGIVLGVLGALLVWRGVQSFLYGVSATDPWTFGVLAAVLSAIALSAAWIPARRAALMDPMVALRYE
jgi:predicted permease